MNNPVINFSHNWNGKLYCKWFTTLRPHNPHAYIVGQRYDIRLEGRDIGPGTIRDIKLVTLAQITPYMAALDAGMGLAEFKALIYNWYKNRGYNWQTQEFDFMLIQQTEKYILPMPEELYGRFGEPIDEPTLIQTNLFKHNDKVA